MSLEIWTNEWMKIEESDGMIPGSDGLMIFLVVGVTIVHLKCPFMSTRGGWHLAFHRRDRWRNCINVHLPVLHCLMLLH